MPHVSLVTFAGFRVHEKELLAYGMTLPGFHDRAQALAELPALGLITLAGMLPDHWTCSYQAPAIMEDDLVERLVSEKPALVAISALTASIMEAYRLCEQLKALGIQTVLGGLHVTACPEEACQYAHAVVVGSGEPVWPSILNDAESGTLQPVYRSPRSNNVPWPVPRYDLLGSVSRFTLQTQRGCPLACDFCAASRLLEQFREKPAEQIRHELNLISARQPGALLELADDNTFAGTRNAVELLDVLRESQARWFTECDWRIAERPEVLSRLGPSGCVQVLMGLESIVFRYPGMGQKKAELQRMVDAAVAIQESGVAVNACFIVGAEGETRESIDRLTEFLLQAPFAEVQLTLQTPYPGTALRTRLGREGRLLPERGWPYYSLFEVTYQPDCMTVLQLEQAFKECATHVYGRPATSRRKRIRLDVWRRNPAFISTSLS